MSVKISRRKIGSGVALYLDINQNGERQRELMGITLTGDRQQDDEKLRTAEILRNRRELSLLTDTTGVVSSTAGNVRLVDYASESTSPALMRSMPRLKEFFTTLHLSGVTGRHLVEYQRGLMFTLKTSTVETYMNALAAVLNRAVREGILTKNPMVEIKRVRAAEEPPKSLTDEELERLMDTPIMGAKGFGGELKRAFLFACMTGLRWSNIKALRWGQVRASTVAGKVRHQVEATQIKTARVVYVPLNSRAWALINPGDRLPPPDERVFPMFVTDTEPNQYLHPWGDAAKVPGLHFHRSRHTFPRFLLDQGVDLVTVQNLMGHKKIETTARYGKASDQQKRDAVDRLDALG